MTNPADEKLIDAQLLDLMLRAGPRWVLWVLIGLSVIVVAVVIERVWFYARERRMPRRLADALAALRKTGPAAALAALDGERSMAAAVARLCLERAGDGIPAVEEHVAATLERERIRFERGLAFLGTLGNNAPFVGLFGTVLGIIRAFHDLAGSSGLGTDAVMTGISQSLVATAVGLAVALPAVASFNAFARHVESAAAAAGATGHEMLAYLKTEPKSEQAS